MKLAKEIYVLSHNDEQEKSYIIYAPLSGKLSQVNEAVLQALKSYEKNPESITTENRLKLIETGFLVEEEQLPFQEFEPFVPVDLLLFPTSECNLKCVYCYADAGKEHKNLSLDIAKAGIDLVVKNAAKSNSKKASLGYHGGGEPTYRWDFLVESAAYFKEQCQKYKVQSRLHLTTNGILNAAQREWIVRNIDEIQLSIDGPEDIHNQQRPFSSGKGSFKQVYETAKFFSQNDSQFMIRTTITENSLNRLQEIYDYFASEFKPFLIHLEPLNRCGRCRTTKWSSPSLMEFTKNYIHLSQEVEKIRKIQKKAPPVANSLELLNTIRTHFCKTLGTGFFITPEGFISSCVEVTLRSDQRSRIFFFGYFDKRKKKLIINEEKRKYLFNRQTQNLKSCANCFIKWNCVGGCPAKISGDLYENLNEPQCDANKLYAKQSLISKITKKQGGKQNGKNIC